MGLNVMFYDESAIKTIASVIGCPMKVDVTTKSAKKGRFARACMEIDLAMSVTRKVCVENQLFMIEYESLRMICGSCDRYGHLGKDCALKRVV